MSADAQMLTLEEVAEEISVSLSSVECWVRTKALASFKKGRTRRVARAALDEFILQNTVRPRRPDWLTPALSDQLRERLREMVRLEIRTELNRAA